MTDLLAPQPMTPDEVADLVERVRISAQNTRERRGLTGRARAAAIWAHDHGKTLAAAGRAYGCDASSVGDWWHRLYPGEITVGDYRRRQP